MKNLFYMIFIMKLTQCDFTSLYACDFYRIDISDGSYLFFYFYSMRKNQSLALTLAQITQPVMDEKIFHYDEGVIFVLLIGVCRKSEQKLTRNASSSFCFYPRLYLCDFIVHLLISRLESNLWDRNLLSNIKVQSIANSCSAIYYISR